MIDVRQYPQAVRILFPLIFLFPIYALILVGIILWYPILWSLIVIYGLWYIHDSATPWQGSNPIPWLRDLYIWKICAAYFDAECVLTAELPADKNYVIACHPHGVIGVGTLLSFASNSTGFHTKTKHLVTRLVTLPINFYIPIHRDLMIQMGVIASDAAAIEHCLNESPSGRAVVIVPGGAEESLDSHHYNYELTLKERKGFVRLAIKNGASLVPVYNFGENKTYHQLANPRGSTLRRVQSSVKKLTGLAPCTPYGYGIFNNKFGIIPIQTKITTVVGAPIPTKKSPNPTTAEINEVHATYIDALTNLFEEHKLKYDIPEGTHLEFV
uniref:Acyltransferase n=1 Tax=Panagrellus redivivus TaxID=6233 RepID=A0A7E4UU76_PANRE